MSTLNMCDMCGVVSSNMAARVYIELNDQLRTNLMHRIGNNPRDLDYMTDASRVVRDLCSDCVGQFFQERKVLTAHPFKNEAE